MKDAIRYTFCYSEDAYTEGVYADCDRLADAGFELVERRELMGQGAVQRNQQSVASPR